MRPSEDLMADRGVYLPSRNAIHGGRVALLNGHWFSTKILWGGWELFDIVYVDNNHVFIMATDGNYVTAERGQDQELLAMDIQ